MCPQTQISTQAYKKRQTGDLVSCPQHSCQLDIPALSRGVGLNLVYCLQMQPPAQASSKLLRFWESWEELGWDGPGRWEREAVGRGTVCKAGPPHRPANPGPELLDGARLGQWASDNLSSLRCQAAALEDTNSVG